MGDNCPKPALGQSEILPHLPGAGGGKSFTLRYEQLSVIPEASNYQNVGIYGRVS